MDKDALFAKSQPLVSDFDFGKQTAGVFDDMLQRSVPFYAEFQRMIGELASEFVADGTHVYCLGCSTCTTFRLLDPILPAGVRFVGIDSSADMLEKSREKLKDLKHPYELVCADLNQGLQISNASLVVMTLTLQFIRPLYRQKLIAQIAQGMNDQGCLIMVEKVLSRHSLLNRLFIKYYYGFKQRSGYSQLEIAQKREALENVLVPYRTEEDMELVLSNGFSQCEVFFKWYNFCGMVAVK